MTPKHPCRTTQFIPLLISLSMLLLVLNLVAFGQDQGEFIPTGVYITPTAAKGSTFRPLNPGLLKNPDYVVGQAVTTAVSPDGNTLLILTSGYNRLNSAAGTRDYSQSKEYIFVFDISGKQAVKKQVLRIPNSFNGLTWNPNGHEFYASGGKNDDVHIFTKGVFGWRKACKPVRLGHRLTISAVGPASAGLAVNSTGNLLIVANYEHDSISFIDLTNRVKIGNDLNLRPGNGVPGGEYPFWVLIKGNTAYVTSQRDREIVVVNFTDVNSPAVSGRIKVNGVPNKMIMNHKQTRLYVALDNSDSVAVIDTVSNKVIGQLKTIAPPRFNNLDKFNGINPNSLTLSPDERMLYVTNGGANSLAVVRLEKDGELDSVVGLIPTGWYPNSVSLNRTGSMLYVVNGKSNAGPNPQACRNTLSTKPQSLDPCNSANQYVWQLTKAGFQSIPVPNCVALTEVTEQVARNNNYTAVNDKSDMMAFLHQKIKHIIYIIKENRTYDQVLGDLDRGNGDPNLTLFPEPLTPNQHKLARDFVTLDNFYDSGETSGDGWNWSTAARTGDTIEKTEPVNYAGRGLSYDYEGTNRNINVGYATVAERRAANPLSPADPNLLPGTADVCAPDDDEGKIGAGYLWDAALKAGVSIRNYGCFIDLARYNLPPPAYISPNIVDPFNANTKVAYPTKTALQDITDQYFRGFDNKFPDFYRVKEWEREFAQYEANGNLPALQLVRLMHDHFGSFGGAIEGVNTVETQVADNDYAVGVVVERIANSERYKDNTLIFVIEDDAQDGPDHVDAHRSFALIAGPYVKQGAVVSTRYTTVSVIRTIGEILGIGPLGINDATAQPMDQAFSKEAQPWTFKSVVPQVLYTETTLPLPPPGSAKNRQRASEPRLASYSKSLHDVKYWEEKTRGFDFAVEDKIDSAHFNRILWEGMKGEGAPYPTTRTGQDLRRNRQVLLESYLRADQGGTAKANNKTRQE